MPPVDWNWSQGVDCVSAFPQPTAPHNMTNAFQPSAMPHDRRPLAHSLPSSQIIQPAAPRVALVPDASSAHDTSHTANSALVDAPSMLNMARPSLAPRTSSFAGRKRSRDETGDLFDDSDISYPSTKAHSPPKFDVDGDDMMLSDASAFNGNGPVAEDLAERLRASSMSGRPLLESRKSIRLDPEQLGLHGGPVIAEEGRPGSGSSLGDFSHDPATLALGPSWSTMLPYSDAHPHLASAMRGWTVFIESQYPLRNVKFEWMKKSEPQGYLVGAIMAQEGYKWRGGSPGYFLFDEDLKRGRMVARSWGNALDALRTGVFEGDTMVAKDHQHGYGLHGEGLDPEGSEMLQGQTVSFPVAQGPDQDVSMDLD